MRRLLTGSRIWHAITLSAVLGSGLIALPTAPVLAAPAATSAIAKGDAVVPVQQYGTGAPKDFLVDTTVTTAAVDAEAVAPGPDIKPPKGALPQENRFTPASAAADPGERLAGGVRRAEQADAAALCCTPSIEDRFPQDWAQVGTRTPLLITYATSTNGIDYTFKVCDDFSMLMNCFSSAALSDIMTWRIPAGKLSWGKQYFWQVTVKDRGTSAVTTSDVDSFTTGVKQPVVGSQLSVRAQDGQEFSPLVGNYTTSDTDAQVAAVGLPLSINRTYNTMDPRVDGMFGAAWTTRWDMKVAPEAGSLLVTYPSGQVLRFAANGDGTFQAPSGTHATLASQPGGGWRLMDKSSTTYLFDATGKLLKIKDHRDRTQDLTYGTDGKLASVEAAGGRSLRFSWTGSHVTQVTTDGPDGGQPLVWTYEYDGDRLMAVCAPVAAPNCTRYNYGSGSIYRPMVLDSDPYGYWRLNEATGTTASDLGWGGGQATYSGVTLKAPGALNGTGDTAASFTNGRIDLPLNTIARMADQASVELWFKTTKPGVLFSAGGTVSADSAIYVGTDGKLRGQFRALSNGDDFTFSPITTNNVVTDGQWHHVVLTADKTTDRLYLDGQAVGELTGDRDIWSWQGVARIANGTLGGRWPAVSSAFQGQIDEVAIYNRPLPSTEVLKHYGARQDARHKLEKVTLPSGRVWATNSYDAATDRLKTHTDQHGGAWTVGEPSYDRTTGKSTVTMTDPQQSTIKYVHDAWRDSRLVSKIDQIGKETTFDYDTGGYLTRVVDPNEAVVTYANDSRGNVLTTTTCRTVSSCQTQRAEYHVNKDNDFDPRNDRMVAVRDGRSSSATDNTYATTWDYNAFGEQIKQITPATTDFPQGRSTTVAYTDGTEPAVGGGITPAGLPKTMTDPRGNSWSYRYNSAGDLGEQTDPEGLVTKLGYDVLGRPGSSTVVSSAFPGGVKTLFTYDVLGRPETLTEPGVKNEVSGVTHTKKIKRAYDADGNPLSETVTDLTGGDAARSTVYTYDGQGRLETVTGPEGGVVRQAWNTLGQLARVTDARGTVIENGYSKRGELIARTLKGWTGSPVNPQAARDVVLEAFAYDPGGRLATQTDAMGRKTSLTYFADHLLSKKIADDAKLNGQMTARDVVLEDHTYDAAGNRVKLVSGGGTATAEVVYDAAGRITSQTFDPGTLKRRTAFTYDANGNVLKAISSGAGTTRTEIKEFGYNKVNQPTRETVENGEQDLVSTLTYDVAGLVTAVTDPRGNVAGASAADFTTTMRYDALGRLVEAVGPQVAVDKAGASVSAKPTTRNGYDTFGATTHQTDSEGRTVTSVFDKAGRLTGEVAPSYTPPGGAAVTPTTAHAYDLAGQLVRTTDPRGNTSTFEYDQLGRQVRATDPAPHGQPAGQSVVDYDLVGEKLAATGPTGARTEATYDDLGRMITSTQVERKPAAAAYTTKLEYNDAGVLTKRIAPGNRSTGFVVNAAGEVTTQTDPATNKTLMEYDLAGRLVKTSDGEGNATVAEYDLAGRQIGAQDLNATEAVVRSAATAYDAAGNPTSATSPEGHVTKQTYDALNRVTSLIEPVAAGESITTSFGYDASGARTRLTDGRGNATWTSYNSLGLAETVTEPSTAAHPNLADRTWTSIYDQAGNPTASLLPGGVRIDRTFDHLGRLTAETGAGGGAATAERTFSYDLAGRATAIGDLTVDYNDRGLPLSVKKGTVQQTGYAYNELGAPSQRVDAAGTATFTWDNVGRLATAVDPVTGRTLTYGYDKSSRLKTLTGKTSTGAAADSQAFTYDAVDRLETQTLKNGAGTQLAKISYGWDKDDNLTTKTTAGTAGAGVNTYTYDHAGRLTSWTAPGGAKTDYGWDASGNRTKAGTKTFTYDERNRLTTGDGTDYTYTARGTLASETKAGATTQLTFDAFDRLVADGESLYSYDALDRVASRIRGAAKQTFAYSGLGNDLAAISDTFGGIQGRYGRDPSGALLGQQEGTDPAAGTLTDLHGDLVATFTGSTLTTTAAYDPFGTVTERTGAKTNLGYQGEYTDPDTGKTNMHARWYQPGTGTFTSRDTATLNPNPSVQANRYTYANASPLTGIDPTGHATESTGFEYGYAGYTGNPCNAPNAIFRCADPATDRSIPGGGMACSGAGLDKCGGFELTGITVMTEEEMKRLGHLPNGIFLEDLEGFWDAPESVRKKIIAKSYAGDSDGVYEEWRKYLIDSVVKAGGSAGQPGPPTPAWKNCVKTLGYKACNAIKESAKTFRDAQVFAENCLGRVVQSELAGMCNRLRRELGVNRTDWILLAYKKAEDKSDRHWFLKLMKGVSDFFVSDLYGCTSGSFGSCMLFFANFIPGVKLGRAAAQAIKQIRKAFGAIDDLVKFANKTCKNSFTSETPVLMADGTRKPIAEVEVGDAVVATDPTTGITAARAVVDVILGEGVKGLVKIAISGEPGSQPQSSTITATDAHPFWAADSREWVDAVDLQPGTWLRSSTGAWLQVQSVERWTAPQQVYNLSVKGIHAYHVGVGDVNVLVHNDSKCFGDKWVSEANLDRHFADHGEEMGLTTLSEYRYAAMDLMCTCNGRRPGVLVKRDGKTYRFYDPKTGEFGAAGPNGIITYFKPDEGIDYFKKQPGTMVD
ncbi:LamG-like jellyroll fold domain-containing protein [Nonomuraea sp. NPDC050394]|uniref:LamG-like jellyroll fold domain-containing protein n=1 Tax=Nonomuraea sp. NPDC050394 TaxID=3364363 RepID=UPI00379353D8